jgi:hypothetical protein
LFSFFSGLFNGRVMGDDAGVLKNAARRIRHMVYEQFAPSELQGAALSFLWGVWIMAPNAKRAGGAATQISHNFSLTTIGTVSILLGLWQLAALYLEHYKSRKIAALCACLYWMWCCAFVAAHNFDLVAVPFLFSFSVSAGWVYCRLENPRGPNGSSSVGG